METEIGEICNYYGGLTVKSEGGKFYWSIENWDGHYREEITEPLYLELIKFNDQIRKDYD